MKTEIKMPSLTDTMESGRLIRWLKQPGDKVESGEAVAEIETDKAITDLEVYRDGYLTGPLAEEDTEIAVGDPVAWIADEAPGAREEDKKGATARDKERAAGTTATKRAPAGKPVGDSAEAKEKEKPPPKPTAAMPNRGGTGEGTGHGAPVVREAFFAWPGARTSTPAMIPDLGAGPGYHLERLKGLRKIIADTMAATVQTPQFRVSSRISMQPLQSLGKQQGISLTALLGKAFALALSEHPGFNAAWTPDGIARREQVNVAIAMDTPYGLTTPVLRDVATREVRELAQDWSDLKARVEHHRAKPEDFRGGTAYLSNLGMFPLVSQFDAIVPLGATAVLSVAAPENQGALFTLNCDHRVVAGADAARFLARLAELVAQPEKWAH